jgi:hypothetical protein
LPALLVFLLRSPKAVKQKHGGKAFCYLFSI